MREGDRKIQKLYLVKSGYVLHNLVMFPVTFVEMHERNSRGIWIEGVEEELWKLPMLALQGLSEVNFSRSA